MTDAERDSNYDVIWDGGEGLVAPRITKTLGEWIPPNRMYNKTGNHTKEAKEAKRLAKETLNDDASESSESIDRIINPLDDDFE